MSMPADLAASDQPGGGPAALEPIETAPVEELRRLQLERLTAVLTRAYERVPHYLNAFD